MYLWWLFCIPGQLNNLPFVSFQVQKKSQAKSLTLRPSRAPPSPPPALCETAGLLFWPLCTTVTEPSFKTIRETHGHTLHQKEKFCFTALDENFEVNEWMMNSLVQAWICNTEHDLYIRVLAFNTSLLFPNNENSALHARKMSHRSISTAPEDITNIIKCMKTLVYLTEPQKRTVK